MYRGFILFMYMVFIFIYVQGVLFCLCTGGSILYINRRFSVSQEVRLTTTGPTYNTYRAKISSMTGNENTEEVIKLLIINKKDAKFNQIILFQSDILYFKFGFKGVIIAEKAQLSSKFQVGITFSNKQLLVHKHRWILFKCFREQAASWPQGATGEERSTGYVQSC